MMVVDRVLRIGLSAFVVYVICAPILAVVFPGAHIVRILAFACGLMLVGGAMRVLLDRVVRIGIAHMTVLCLLVVGCVSALIASYAGPAWWGIGFEFGTVGSLVLFATSFFLGSSVRHEVARLIPLGLTAVSVVVSVCVVSIVVVGIDVRTFSAGWPVLTVVLAVALTVCAHFVDVSHGLRKLYGVPLAGIIAAGIWCLAHPAAWYVILASALCASFLLVRANTRPFCTAAVFIFGVVGLLYASHAPFVPAVPDIRPSVEVSRDVLVPTLFERAPGLIFGAGPNGFSAGWDRYKPLGVNATPLWNRSFTEAHSSLLTLLAMFGVLGFVAFSFVAIASLYRGIFDQRTDHVLFVVAMGLVVGFCVFPVGTAAFVLIGLSLGSMMSRDGEDVQLNLFSSRMVAAILVLLGCSVCYAASAQTIAAVYASRAADLQDSQESVAVEIYARVVRYWPAPVYERDYAYALMRHMNETLVSAEDETRLDLVFAQDAALAVEMINKSVSPGIHSYSLWIDRAALFIAFAKLGIAESEHEANISLNQAAVLSPTSPTVPFMRALLADAVGDPYEARMQAQRALDRKPDYADALSLYTELRAAP